MAINEFEKFNTKDYTLYTEIGNWYKALCFVKLNEFEKANQTIIWLNAQDRKEKKKPKG